MRKIVDKLRKSTNYQIKFKELADKLRGYDRYRDVFQSAIEFLEDRKIIEIVKRKNKSNNESTTKWIHLLEK